MAHKTIGGWLIRKRLYAAIKVSNELWYFDREETEKNRTIRKTSLLFVGWYDVHYSDICTSARLYTINVLFISIQVAISL